MTRRIALVLALAATAGATLATLPTGTAAQVCVPGVSIPGCPPPSQPPSTPPGTGPPGSTPSTPAPPEPAACSVQRRRGRSTFVGLVSEDVFAGGPNYRSCTLNQQVAAGVALMRQTFDWKSIETSRGKYDFSFYDAYVAALAQHGIRVLPVLYDAPTFRARHARRGTYPPRRYSDLGRFGAVLVRRYGPRGSFWKSRRDLPKLAIRAWEIWNEPLIRLYWLPKPNARQYTRLLRATGRIIKRADPGAEILTAGLPNSRLGIPLNRYVAAMYRAGARSAFDTLAINPYAHTTGGVLALLKGIRRLMNRNGDRRGRIWVTEFGWATGGPRSRFKVSTSAQARRISAALRALHRSRGRLRLRGAVYYNWRDGKPYPPLYQDFFGLHTGLLNANGKPKPSLASFSRAARGLR